MNEPGKDFWNEEPLSEWVSFTEGIPVEIVIEDATPRKTEVRWGTTNTIRVWEFPEGQLYGGISKFLKIDSKRLRSGIRNSTPSRVPKPGDGYIIVRTGEGFQTRYSVRYAGFFKLKKDGSRELIDTAQKTLKGSSKKEDTS